MSVAVTRRIVRRGKPIQNVERRQKGGQRAGIGE
jgi:hypothetical protein